MENNILNTHYLEAILWTLTHSLWQFSLIGLIVYLLLRRQKSATSTHKYNVSVVGLLTMGISAILTFIYYGYNQDSAVISSQEILYISNVDNWNQTLPASSLSTVEVLKEWLYQNRILIFLSWGCGVVVLLVRLGLALGYIVFLKNTSTTVINDSLSKSLSRLQAHFNGKSIPAIRESAYISSPMLVGFIKPLILLPFASINNLSSSEVEAILAHEISHHLRKDLIVNLCQHVLEIIFYYHPAIWWISKNIREERENCCDDMAMGFIQNKVSYAKTLIKVQEMQHHISPTLAMHLATKNSAFTNRIKRILDMQTIDQSNKSRMLVLSAAICIMLFSMKNLYGAIENDVIKIFTSVSKFEQTVRQDTMPKSKQKSSISIIENDKTIKLTKEDDKITSLEIDGKVIPPSEYGQYEDELARAQPLNGNGKKGIFFFDGNMEDSQNFLNFHVDSIMGQIGNLGLMGRDLEKLYDQNKFMLRFDDAPFNSDSFPGHVFRFNLKDLNMDSLMTEDLGRFPGMGLKDFSFNFPEGEHDDNWGPNAGSFGHMDDRNDYQSILGNALNSDGLLIPGKINNVELTGKHLKINGEKQPSNLWDKYKRIFEEESGLTLEPKSKLNFKIEGLESKRKYRVF